MTISFEISNKHVSDYPPFSDGCPRCAFPGTVVPLATITSGDSLIAFYKHGRCGNQWSTSWGAQWTDTWVRVGPTPHAEAVEAARQLALPGADAA